MNGEKELQRTRWSQPARHNHREPNPRQNAPLSRTPALAGGALIRRELRALSPQVGNRLLQRLASDGEFAVPERVERAIEGQTGAGKPLAHSVRGPMERALGTDLSSTRVHDDPRAAELNQDLSARAFTNGHDIFFGAGEYAPDSGEGQQLLAHELTHVMQQRDGAKLIVGAANDPAEQEADAVARAVVQRLRYLSRQPEEEEEEPVQALRRQEMPEEEEEAQALRRQEMPEEEEEAQALRRQETPEEEEEAQAKRRGSGGSAY